YAHRRLFHGRLSACRRHSSLSGSGACGSTRTGGGASTLTARLFHCRLSACRRHSTLSGSGACGSTRTGGGVRTLTPRLFHCRFSGCRRHSTLSGSGACGSTRTGGGASTLPPPAIPLQAFSQSQTFDPFGVRELGVPLEPGVARVRSPPASIAGFQHVAAQPPTCCCILRST